MQRTLRLWPASCSPPWSPPPTRSPPPYASRTLREGSSGTDVRVLQRNLDRAGQDTTADGEFGPATESSLRAFEAAEDRRADGVATRSDQRLVRKRAAGASSLSRPRRPAARPRSPEGLAVPPAAAPQEVRPIIEAGNTIASKPYKYGGGHGRWRDTGYDCSGSVSYALHGAELLDAAARLVRVHELGRARARRVGHDPDQPEPRLHGRGGTALRHERP